jgi:hypothetical protein
MNKFIDAFKYVFSQKDWEKKVGLLFVAYLVFSFVAGIISFSLQLPLEIANTIAHEAGNNSSLYNSLSSMASSLSSVLMLPITFYILGYTITVVKNIFKDKSELLPDHNDIGNTFIKGLKLYASTFIATLPSTIIGAVIFVTTLIGSIILFTVSNGNPLTVLFGIILILLTILLFVLISVVNTVITYACWYIYIQTGSFRSSISYKSIIAVIRENEKQFLKLILDLIILGFIQFFMAIGALLVICIFFVTIPAVAILGYFAKAYIVGHAFKNMNKLELK